MCRRPASLAHVGRRRRRIAAIRRRGTVLAERGETMQLLRATAELAVELALSAMGKRIL